MVAVVILVNHLDDVDEFGVREAGFALDQGDQHLNQQAQEIRQLRVEKRNVKEFLNRPPSKPIQKGDYV